MYTVTISLPKGPTILDEDTVLMTIVRVCHTAEQLTALQKAADVLGAATVNIERSKS